MHQSTPTVGSEQSRKLFDNDRVVAIDALRGFDMFSIMGGKPLIYALTVAMLQVKEPPQWLKTQFEHTHWVGFSCYDLIMPLFIFLCVSQSCDTSALSPLSFEGRGETYMGVESDPIQ